MQISMEAYIRLLILILEAEEREQERNPERKSSCRNTQMFLAESR